MTFLLARTEVHETGSLVFYLSCVPETQPEADMCLRVPWILIVRRGEGLGEMELELWWTVETPCRWGSHLCV